ncbi:MAG: CBS domain-containing protein [Clostridia bacterium]|nr:CBS domain-containing protein [Clostridia bacterium]
MKDLSNARRFINAYNQIDYALRAQHNFKRSMGFSDMIRRAVSVNHIVRKYEDDLIDIGRLRNAIIHGSNDDVIIAEPHEDVVLKIEHLERLITTPPKALDVLEEKEDFTVNFDLSIKDVIKTISETKFSNLPVYKNGELIGVANGQKILNVLGEQLLHSPTLDEYITNHTIEEVVKVSQENNYYEIIKSDATIDQVMKMFLDNRKLLVVIITKTGTMHEPPLAIITSTDYMVLNKIMENY